MMTGVEAIGLLLAVLLLVVNQLDNYVQSLQILKLFRGLIYRCEIKGYLRRVESQKALLLNNLEQSLEGVVDYEDELSELINNPRSSMWRDQSSLMIEELSLLLQDLCQKLVLDPKNQENLVQPLSKDFEQKMTNSRYIFSRSIYLDLLSRVEVANDTLLKLVEQSRYGEPSRRTF
ncbi:hypothetical protein BGW36DRAFT_431870 [Talaromyces proteolyticus]|uniref:Prion-inhibition and propagation HeLo domain-containing protein n=1 Tax=Talaromyces proteolyticus TaxID=1131652 RepID=A0AAD4KKG7_9EURO|nr:uncharacterized protein BGW36DRAFT_431870 [Talaromyces proteolyticus]KAH8691321.1 hypothetical protein BGW36DRAFT_431870 [Talaromyces proteolyticus]